MKEIRNPFSDEHNPCFGCSGSNPAGLRLKFFETEEYLLAEWTPGERYQGYPNVLHGGIIATLLDETGAWCIYIKAETAGVTTSMEIKYHNPVHINKGPMTIKARLEKSEGTEALVHCTLLNSDSKLCAEAFVKYFIYPKEIAVKRMRYPGKEAFYS